MPEPKHLSMQGNIHFVRQGMEQNGKAQFCSSPKHAGTNMRFICNSQVCIHKVCGVTSSGIYWINERSGRNVVSDCMLELDSDQNLMALIQGALMIVEGH